MLKKTVLLSLFLCCSAASLLAEEINTATYFSNSLQIEGNQFSESQKNTFDQLNFVRKSYDILVDFINTADEDEFYEQLRLLKPSIEMMSEVSNTVFFQIHPKRQYERRPFKLDGSDTYLYHNIFSQKHSLTDEERTAFYEEEMERHQGVKLQPKQQLTKDVIKTLAPGQPYNFIINSQKEAYISYEQGYRLKAENGKPLLNTQGHTFLAGNNPVLTAGVFNYHKVGNKELYFVACASGHFHPTPDSLVHMKNYLVKLGVPEEAIVVLSMTYDQIVSQCHKIKYGPQEN